MSRPIARKLDGSTVCNVYGIGEMSMEDYSAYIRALSYKPYLSKREASTLFGIGINRLSELMSDPDCPFVTPGDEPKHRKVHRRTLEDYMLLHNVYGEGDRNA